MVEKETMEDMDGIFPAWAHSVEETMSHHGVDDVTEGLNDAQVMKRRARFGYNELKKPPATSMWQLILEQFDDTLVKVCS